ncbi:MAG: ABC transporter ATP-binding protein [Clostridiaceae bacterium]|jgi:ATP-binding cassette subfamily B protein|nr:ABC transporter ATP-binding protein [Bacillota bacterium]NLN51712.1 ABC transporter ATP-binding protein [Clostridiaceae bacterium]
MKDQTKQNKTKISDRQINKIKAKTWLEFIKLAAPRISLLIGLIATLIILAILENISPLLIRFAIDHFIQNNLTDGLIIYSVIYLIIILIIAFCTKAYLKLSGRIETEMSYNIRKRGFEHLQNLSFSFYDRTPVGWLLSRMINDVTRLCEVIAFGLIDFVWGGFTIVVILIAMLFMNLRLGLIALIAFPVVIAMTIHFQKKMLRTQREIRRLNSVITGEFNEGIMGARTTKTLLREKENELEFFETAREMNQRSIDASKMSAYFLPTVSLVGIIVAALILVFGGDAYMNNLIEIGTIYALFTYALRLWDPIRQVAGVFSEMQAAQAAAERVISLLNEPVEITDNPDVIKKYGLQNGSGELPWPEIKGTIEFKNVSFSYLKDEIVLDNFNLKIEAGETVAIVGETGAGKTTIVNLACRFYEPQKGQILIDNIDIRNLPQAWLYQNLGYVIQTPHLFSGTITDNIRYGRLEATEQEIKSAAKLVHADNFIEKMENGYATDVGEGGGRLSTGEKQLISFARAIIADPAIFILDEATSSIDTETEKQIQEAIDIILEKRTALIIAHRLSTIKNADRIIVLDNGKIIEQGSHQELLKAQGHYFNLYTGQFIIDQNV